MTDKKRILWVNDYSLEEIQGGANITSQIWIEQGRKEGFEITELSAKQCENAKDKGLSLVQEYDLIILNNINAFPIPLIEHVVHKTKFMKVEHDYCFCKFRSAQCWRCKLKCDPGQLFQTLFANSLLNVFFSPQQLNIFKEFFGVTMRDAICIPAPLEPNTWGGPEVKKKEQYLFAGVLLQHKGVHQIIDYAEANPDKTFHFAGKAISKKIFDRIKDNNFKYLGEIKHDEMPKLIAKYKYFIVNPLMRESFGTSVIEAMASGCDIIKFAKSEKYGFESYGYSRKQMLNECLNSHLLFWKKVKEVLL